MYYTVHGILQARTLEWIAFPFSRDLPNPGIEPRSPALQAILYQLSHKGSPLYNELVVIHFSTWTIYFIILKVIWSLGVPLGMQRARHSHPATR